MPDPRMTVQIGAEEKELIASLSRSAQQIKEFADGAKDRGNKLATSWESTSKRIGASLSAMSAGLTGSLVAIGNEGAKFEAAMRYVNSSARLPEAQFKALEKQVISLSQTMNTDKGPTEMAKGLYDIVGAGFSGNKAMAILKVSTMAATAGMTDLSTASKAVTTVMAAFQLPAEKAALVGDILAVSAEKGRLHLSELAQSIGPAATKAAAFGVSLEEVGAAMSILARTMPASEASTALEKLITQIAAPTEKSAKALNAMGVETGKAALQKKGLVGVINELVVASKGDDQALRRALSTSEGLTAAFNLAAGSGKDFYSVLNDMQHSAGHLAEANDEVMKSTIQQWGKLRKEIEIGAVSMRDSLLPIAGDLLKIGSNAVKAFNDATPAQKKFTAESALAAAGITGVAGAAFLALPQLVALGAILGGPLTVALGLVVGASAAFAVGWAGDLGRVRKDTEQAVSNLKGYFKDFSDWLKDFHFELPKIDWQAWLDGISGVPTAKIKEMLKKAQEANSPWGSRAQDADARDAAERRARLGSAITEGNPERTMITRTGDNVPRPAGFLGPMTPATPVPYNFTGPVFDSVKNLEYLSASLRRFASDTAKLSADAAGTYTYGPERVTATPGSVLGNGSGKKKKLTDAEMLAYIKANAGTSLAPEIGGLNEDTLKALYKLVENSVLARVKLEITSAKRHGSGGSFHNSGQAVDVQLPGHTDFHDQAAATQVRALSGGTGFRSGIDEYMNPIPGVSTGGHIHLTTGMETGKGSFAVKGGGKGGASAISGAWEKLQKEIADSKEKFGEYVLDEYAREEKDIRDKAKEAMAGATSAGDKQKVTSKMNEQLASLRDRKSTEQTQAHQDLQGGDITAQVQQQGRDEAKSDFDYRKAMIGALADATKQQVLEKRQLESAANLDRIAEINSELAAVTGNTQEEEKVRRDLLTERRQLETDQQRFEQANRDDSLAAYQSDLEFRKQMGQVSSQDYLLALQNELQQFTLTEDQKRALTIETHQLQLQLDQERFASADAVSGQLNSDLQNFLQTSLSGSQSFGDAFKNLWKGVMNQILQSIAQAIVKALALQVIMRGIFGFFGGIFGGALGIGSVGATDVGGEAAGLVIAHTGGYIGANGLESFHSGGLVGGLADFKQDEVLAKLQTGEAVLSRRQISNLQDSAGSSGAGITQHIYITGNASDPSAIARAIAQETKWRLQGVAS